MLENLFPRKLWTELKFAYLQLLLIDLMLAFGSHALHAPLLPAVLEGL